MKKTSLTLIVVATALIGFLAITLTNKPEQTQPAKVSETSNTTNTQLLSDEDLQKRIKARR